METTVPKNLQLSTVSREGNTSASQTWMFFNGYIGMNRITLLSYCAAFCQSWSRTNIEQGPPFIIAPPNGQWSVVRVSGQWYGGQWWLVVSGQWYTGQWSVAMTSERTSPRSSSALKISTHIGLFALGIPTSLITSATCYTPIYISQRKRERDIYQTELWWMDGENRGRNRCRLVWLRCRPRN